MSYLFKIAAVFGTVILSVNGQLTLTTAKEIPNTTPKPTRVLRRINVGRNYEERTEDPLDLFRLWEPERRTRNRDTIWNWDFWCQLQPKSGNCTTMERAKTAFYYDAQLDQCLSFIYSGCHGNKNNFDTLVECERHCKGAIYMPLKESDRTGSCSLQPNSGLCMALLDRYYYDVNTDACKTFIYGGCGGNQNRFHSYMECSDICKDEEFS